MPQSTSTVKRFTKRKFKKHTKQEKKIYSIAKKAATKIVKAIPEKHYFDTVINNTIDSSGSIFDLSLIPQGDTDTSREGDRVRMTSIQWRGQAYNADTSNVLRFVFFQWLMDDGVDTPQVSEILQATMVGNPYAVYAPYAKDYAGYKFAVLYDEILCTSQNGDANNIFSFNFPIKKNKKITPNIQYVAATTSGTNKLFVMVISDSGAITHPSAIGVFRIRFLSD